MAPDQPPFRPVAGRIASALTDAFGPARIDLIEDAVQDAFLESVRRWGAAGAPENPEGWLYRVARNRLTDALRKERTRADYEHRARTVSPLDYQEPEVTLDGEISDAELRMMFACCDPALSTPSQIAIILKILCGLSVAEIASALLAGEDAVRKRVLRARRRLAENGDLILPSGSALETRLGAVQHALYLMFNEGYCSRHPDGLIRRDLCGEAIRLARMLADHPVTGVPSTWALLALLNFHLARFESRVDEEGKMVLLEDQDRSRWDRTAISEGFRCLDRSAAGESVSRFHLEAGIAGRHCLAPTAAATDWGAILALYDDLVALTDSPVHHLNRAVALGEVEGPERGLEAIARLGESAYGTYLWFHAVRAELELRAGHAEAAEAGFEAALGLTDSPAERALILRKLARCRAAGEGHWPG